MHTCLDGELVTCDKRESESHSILDHYCGSICKGKKRPLLGLQEILLKASKEIF